MRERNASVIPGWMREPVAGGVRDSDVRGIVSAVRAPIGPTGVIPEAVRPSGPSGRPAANVPVSGSGWAREIPLGPPPGVAQADRLMDAQDAKDKAERIREAAQLRAMDKLDAMHAKIVEGKK